MGAIKHTNSNTHTHTYPKKNDIGGFGTHNLEDMGGLSRVCPHRLLAFQLRHDPSQGLLRLGPLLLLGLARRRRLLLARPDGLPFLLEALPHHVRLLLQLLGGFAVICLGKGG